MTQGAVVLCDPGLLTVPDDDQLSPAFWRDVVEWAADNRLRLGPHASLVIYRHFETAGWPQIRLRGCPSALVPIARQAILKLIGRTVSGPVSDPVAESGFDPSYAGSEYARDAIGADAALLHAGGLALATRTALWTDCSESVRVDPGPPTRLELLTKPNGELAVDEAAKEKEFYRDKRLTIIGGVDSSFVRATLERRFGIPADEIRWRPSELSSDPNLDCLGGVDPTRDVVFCITGHISHSASGEVDTTCTKRNVTAWRVRRVNEIAAKMVEIARSRQ